MIMLTRAYVSFVGFALLGWCANGVGKEPPSPDTAPVTTAYQAQDAKYAPAPGTAYGSYTLGASFRSQWMYIVQLGQQKTFWGARIVGMEPGSPLHALGVHLGDVITRLDGISICDDMLLDQNGVWQLPEAERHFGATEVRFIISGTNDVRVGQIILSAIPFGQIPLGSPIEPVAP